MKLNKSILILGPLPEPINGCSLANDVLLKNLIKRQYSCDAINTSMPQISSKQGESFSFNKALRFLAIYLKLYKVAKNDILYITPGQTFFGILKYAPFILVAKLLKKPYVIHIHGNYLGTQYKLLNSYRKTIFHSLLSTASAGIVLSKSLLNNFDGLLERERLYIVENFFDSNVFHRTICKKEINKLRLIYLSNLMEEKGILEFLDSLEILNQKNIDFEAIIAGAIDIEIEDKFYSKLKKNSGKVKYIGTVFGEDKERVLLESNVFVLPTYYKMEGQPISIIEALCTGNIIVSTKHAGIPDIVSTDNGFLLPKNSVPSLVSCLENINNNLEKYIEQFSEKNIRYAFSNFKDDVFVDKIINVFDNLYK